ncbi:carbon-nitrogen hydrolase family protein [Pseudidiomarina taiwanensis]|uniref:Amidohydrolase n=1 Tax=Pseudidiomarina taiwanensis TaxID=337250 RepID=A0A432ZKS5_9GAMM|nr:carbon-nitrogen hydrolase family protein [Pseudidiomarina taiwanensis]RUO78576.1 amidohydrolase [Pseudidiomarina taiwanensis]
MANQTVQVTALQLTSSPDPAANLAELRELFASLPEARPQLVVLPEACLCFGAGDKQTRALAELPGQGPMQEGLAQLARDFGIWLVGGTIPLIEQPQQPRFRAACLVFNPHGEQVGRYDKIHLFDVDVADNTRTYRESEWTEPGTELTVIDTEFGRLGLAVCYDIRFPELFTALRQRGAELIALPAAFTQVTGAAHWHVLTRARAIEQQAIMVAAAQAGVYANGRETYGHAMVIDGWGRIVTETTDHTPQWISAPVKVAELSEYRQQIPLAAHRAQAKKVYE